MADELSWLRLRRGLLRLSGADGDGFLQGLLSNDVTKAVGGVRAIYQTLATAQGRLLHDMIQIADGPAMLLDVDADRVDDLYQRLRRFRLRAQVEISDVSADWTVTLVWGPGAPAAFGLDAVEGLARRWQDGIAAVDPRLVALGVRLWLPAASQAIVPGTARDADAWRRHRLALAVPEAPVDLVPEHSLLLETNLDALHAIDWKKGCFIGQEITARTHYRGLLKRRLVAIRYAGSDPAPGAAILRDGAEVGEVRDALGGVGLAMLRLDALAGPLRCGDQVIDAALPNYIAAA